MRFALAMVFLAMAGATQPLRAQDAPIADVELPAELDRVLRDYERAWQAGDAVALAALFTEDGFVTRPGGWVRGRAAIRERYAGMAGGDLRLRAHEHAVDGAVAWIVGSYGYALGPTVTDAGKFVLALRSGPDGRWLIAADIDAANR